MNVLVELNESGNYAAVLTTAFMVKHYSKTIGVYLAPFDYIMNQKALDSCYFVGSCGLYDE